MIKKLLGSVREYKKTSILCPIFVMLNVLVESVIPLMMANLIDLGIDAGNMTYIIKIGLALVIASACSLTFDIIAGRFAATASAGFAHNLRKDMFFNVQNFSFSNIDRFSSASIVTRLTTDVTNVQNSYQMMIRMAVRSPITLVFSMLMAFTINPQLALVFMACIPVLGVGLYLIMSKAFPTFKRVFKTYDKLNAVVGENLHGIRVVKSFVREDFEVEKFKNISEDLYRDYSTAEKILSFNMPLMQFCVYTCMLLISWFGARLIVSGNLTTGQLMSLITYAMHILMSLMMLSMVFVMITMSRASAERIIEVLEERSDLTNCEEPITDVKNGDISFKNVSFSYSNDTNKLVLSDVNLDIKSGETVGILGGTGSAKTTLVQLIPRLYDTTCGTLFVGGEDVRNYDINTLRSEVAMVLQKNILFSGTIKENLRWGNENATDEELVRVCKLAQADEFISKFPEGYDTHIEQGGTNVSGGQKQRLCIARALLKKPKILILDDSTSAVDTQTDASIRKAFREEIPNTTKLIIAQRVSSIQDANKIVVLDNGKISAIGTHDDLLKTCSIYQEVFYSQTKGGKIHE